MGKRSGMYKHEKRQKELKRKKKKEEKILKRQKTAGNSSREYDTKPGEHEADYKD